MATTDAQASTDDGSSQDTTRLESKLSIHEFHEKILDKEVHFIVLRLKDSFMIWIGSGGGAEAAFAQLAVAMSTPYSSTPMSSGIFGDGADVTSQNLATKMAKRCGGQVFVSYNLPQETLLATLVEERLVREIKSKPEKF